MQAVEEQVAAMHDVGARYPDEGVVVGVAVVDVPHDHRGAANRNLCALIKRVGCGKIDRARCEVDLDIFERAEHIIAEYPVDSGTVNTPV